MINDTYMYMYVHRYFAPSGGFTYWLLIMYRYLLDAWSGVWNMKPGNGIKKHIDSLPEIGAVIEGEINLFSYLAN